MRRMISFMVSSLAGRVAIHWPSRMMVTSSEMRRISSILWEMYTMPQPRSRSMLIILKRCSTSCSVSEEVGSSKTMTLALKETALAISTIWRCDTGMVLMMVLGLTLMSSSLKTLMVSSYICFSEMAGVPLILG